MLKVHSSPSFLILSLSRSAFSASSKAKIYFFLYSSAFLLASFSRKRAILLASSAYSRSFFALLFSSALASLRVFALNFSIIIAFSASSSALGLGGKDFCILIGLALGTITTGGLWLTFLAFFVFLSFLLTFLVFDLSDFAE